MHSQWKVLTGPAHLINRALACCREDKYAITDEELRPYFALPNVLDGLFGLAKRLFDVDIEAADGQVAPLSCLLPRHAQDLPDSTWMQLSLRPACNMHCGCTCSLGAPSSHLRT